MGGNSSKITPKNVVGCIYELNYFREDGICVITDVGYPDIIYLSYIMLSGKKRGEKDFIKRNILKMVDYLLWKM